MKFQTKIMICVMLLISLTFGVGGSVLISSSFQNSLTREKSSNLYTYQMIVHSLDTVADVEATTRDADMHTVLYQLDAQTTSWSALRLSRESAVLYQSGKDELITASMNDGEPNSCFMQVLSNEGDRYLQISGQLDCGKEIYQLDALFPLKDLYRSRNVQISNYQWIFIAVLILGALVSWFVIRFLTNPLRVVSLTLRRITAGDLSCRAEVTTNDEIGDLALDLNQMTDRLESNIENLKSSMTRQEEFMGSFAHEMKTPMTAIIGYADLLRSNVLSEEEQQEAANFIFKEGRRLESLSLKMLDLLVLGRKELVLQPTQLSAILEDVMRLMTPVLENENISLLCQSCEGVCLLDSDMVHSLLINLIDNARKATERGGTIKISADMTNEGCVFVVADTGCGMAPKELDKITEAFYRVDKSRSRAQGGTGLGLSLCQKIVEGHNGTLHFESTPGLGTSVRVELKGGRL